MKKPKLKSRRNIVVIGILTILIYYSAFLVTRPYQEDYILSVKVIALIPTIMFLWSCRLIFGKLDKYLLCAAAGITLAYSTTNHVNFTLALIFNIFFIGSLILSAVLVTNLKKEDAESKNSINKN